MLEHPVEVGRIWRWKLVACYNVSQARSYTVVLKCSSSIPQSPLLLLKIFICLPINNMGPVNQLLSFVSAMPMAVLGPAIFLLIGVVVTALALTWPAIAKRYGVRVAPNLVEEMRNGYKKVKVALVRLVMRD